jgi:hypothetical protein
MKAKKTTIISTLSLAVFICITAFTTSTKKVILNPQEQDLGGWYADGVRIDTLKCYGFKNLQLVVPYNAEWSAYSQLSVNIFADNMHDEFPGTKTDGGCKLIPMTSVSSFVKGKYLVYNFFNQGEIPAADLADFVLCRNNEGLPWNASNPQKDPYKIFRFTLKSDNSNAKNEGKPAPDFNLSFRFFGLTKTGEKEEFSSACNCLIKYPTYNAVKLTKTYSLTCTNRTQKARFKPADPSYFNQPCTYTGTKVDFNTLGK